MIYKGIVILSATFTFFSLTQVAYAVVDNSVPFTSQAPFSDWREPWHNACEETSIVMVNAFYAKRTAFTKTQAKKDILDLFKTKNTYIGYSFDESTKTMQQLINEFLPWEATIVLNPTLESIKTELDEQRPVIIPVLADLLNNPHFLGTFPYHVLVISGYDETTQEFITQEPGTRHGKNYRYSYSTLLTAMRDFDTVDITRAPQRVLFTSPTITSSGDTDGDNDGLTKYEEMLYQTSLSNPDTDADGYIDGVEINSGHSPLDNETQLLKSGAILKATDSSAVFLYKDKMLFAFANEKAFLSRGYRWTQVQLISPLLRDLQTRGGVLY